MEGWIKLYRKFTEWEWFNISEMVHLFIYLLLNANHEDGNWRGISVKRGQIITGLNSLHERTGISKQTLRTCLERLEMTKEINKKSTNKYSLITICNYDSYQVSENTTNTQDNNQATSNQQSTNIQSTTNKNIKNDKNEKKYKNIPPSLEEIELRIKERGITTFTADKFFAKYEANGWMVGKTKMKNWDAALTYWNKNQFNHGSNNKSTERQVKRVNDFWS